MSDLFTNPDHAENLLAHAQANSIDSFDDLAAPFWRGFGSGTFQGVMRGGANVATAAGILAGGMYDRGQLLGEKIGDLFGLETYKGTEVQDAIFRATENVGQSAVDFWTPRPNEVGHAGQVVGGLGEVALPLMAAGGNPELLVATQTAKSGKELVDQGVDAGTAGAAAAIEGVAAYAGMKVPIAGSNLWTRMVTGAAGNVALGSVSRGTEKNLLESQGYEKQAKAFEQSGESVATDALVGVLFGGAHHLGVPALKPSQVDAALTLRNIDHFARRTAPGEAATPTASAAHQSALETAMNQMARGEQVDVGAAVAKHEGAQFVDDGRVAANAELARRVTGEQPEGFRYKSDAGLSPSDQAIESRFGAELGADIADAEARYNAIKDTKGGKVLSVDTARELSPDYLKDRTRSAAVHEPASAFIKRLYARKLGEAPGEGEIPMVLFTAGGTGAGKTTAISKALGPVSDRAQIVYDTNLSGLSSSVQKIDQALAAGKEVQIAYTYREPIDALREGALTRAMGQENEYGSGRTVPVSAHLDTHIGARDTIEKIAAHYAGDPRVQITVIDNSLGHGNAKRVALSSIPKFDERAYNSLREQALKVIEEERAAGRISQAVYRGFIDDAGTGQSADSAAAQRGAGRGTGGEPQPQRAVAFETGGEPPAPGTRFLVARVASSGSLENRNAGNPQAIAEFLARLDDVERPQPVGAEKSDTLYVYQVTAPEKFGAYELGTRGTPMKGETVGRKETAGAVTYSFPKDTAEQPLFSIPLDEARAKVHAATGTESFDDLGSIEGGRALDTVIAEKLNEKVGPPSEASLDEALAAKPAEESPTPEIAALSQLVEQNPDAEVLVGFDENGNPAKMKAADAMDAIRAEYEQAINDTKAYDVAVSCFMGHG